jgi:predicted AAA+ superfamily ATPase
MLHSKEKITPRTILNKLVSEMDRPFVTVLIGPRQVGKTVLMRMVEERAPCKTVYLDMENPMDAVALRDGLETLLSEIGTERQVLLLDEFHRIPDALSLFKQIRDGYPQIKVYASGSSSIEIHSHLKQSAVGRVRRTRIFPLSFPEWCHDRVQLNLSDWNPLEKLPPREARRLDSVLEEFITWGGMPEPANLTDEMERREALHEICALYLEKDIRSLLKNEEMLKFNEFLRLMGIRMGQIMNRSEFSRQLGISSRQVEKQLMVMEHTYVYRPVVTDYANPTKRLIRAPKIYWYDNGVRNALVRDFRGRWERPDGGALLENHIFCELEKAAGIDTDILYHRTRDGQEIDFILERDRQKILVEVKSGLGRAAVPNAIRDMLVREDAIGAVVLNNQIQNCTEHNGKPVLFLPHTLAHTVPQLWDRLPHRGSAEICNG